MANTRSLSTATTLTAAPGSASVAAASSPSTGSARHRLRAVGGAMIGIESLGENVADFLPPGATWLPAPQHTLPTLPGQPPMVGYLVLVPADQQPPVLPLGVAGERAGDGTAAGGVDADPLVRVDTVQRTAEVDGRQLDLTYLEFELLAHLVAHPHRVHTRDQLVTTVWGYGHVGDGRTVDVHIARLRRKLGAEFRQAIQTVRRVGYKYAPPVAR
ncbi:winged helix family transcriptional regulator [Streptomyces ipomoeae]|jgi:hypothetical protein|uniref:Transcriptional regulatory protein, C-terminal domain protein n=2 Tax=Streptomyces ipomoeae TaxID=103232 RepID=L1KPG3_9ACTN|nr:winged helix-turn-helix domain-containing protein [Streptomyces ipomoeae]EKX62444.1 transcriptional regulatory protein, C-terminal domain protein [Streptomyces ipomoeae 91-03]MDX2699343.1 winged helix-turn-helix domain-containing protein [Streptomyces ipomoeae]MDX2826185.1 winged helix-turn-helix domain-containing protein [Streptomyces ipomoeae]MDX2845338.1 winged helix-turn-helix domain-containing protein [Streptomyces ipomoeae]MDX2879109.1 winged helix-turn-helix domain-containing protein